MLGEPSSIKAFTSSARVCPAQDREGRWKFTAKAKKEFAKALNQQEIEELKNIRGKQ
jgi:hypothetical protein